MFVAGLTLHVCPEADEQGTPTMTV